MGVKCYDLGLGFQALVLRFGGIRIIEFRVDVATPAGQRYIMPL